MLHLLQLEWKKLAPNRLFKITLFLYLLLLPLLFLSVKTGNRMDDEGSAVASLYQSLYQFPALWDTITYMGSWLTFFLLTYLVMFSVTSEYGNKTLRQNLLTGMSRNEWLTGKVLLVVVLSLGAVLYTFLVGLILGQFMGGYGQPFTRHLIALGYFFMQSVFYGSVALFLAVLFRRGGLALMSFFAYMLIIERIIRYQVFGNLLGDLAMGSYLPAAAAWDAVPLFILGKVPDSFNDQMDGILLEPGLASALLIGYTALFLALTYRDFNRRDL